MLLLHYKDAIPFNLHIFYIIRLQVVCGVCSIILIWTVLAIFTGEFDYLV